jgi:hypothetical protein
LKFAIMLVLFLVIMVGCYWFLVVPSGRNAEEGGTPPPREP